MKQIEIKKGKELSKKEIDIMEKARIKEYGENTKDFKKYELDSIFFFVKDDGQIVSFGMLKPITISYLNRIYKILGIGNILSIKKGGGYGRELINFMIDYLRKKGKTGLGFCGKDNSKFYEKCGLKVKKDLALRFRYRYATVEEEKRELEEGGDGIYFEGKDGFIKKILSTKSLAYMGVPFW